MLLILQLARLLSRLNLQVSVRDESFAECISQVVNAPFSLYFLFFLFLLFLLQTASVPIVRS
jgi:hypothetical protein